MRSGETAQFFRRRLRQLSPRTLAALHFAGHDRNGAILADVQPRGDIGHAAAGKSTAASTTAAPAASGWGDLGIGTARGDDQQSPRPAPCRKSRRGSAKLNSTRSTGFSSSVAGAESGDCVLRIADYVLRIEDESGLGFI